MHPTNILEAKRSWKSIKRVANRLSNTHVVLCPPSIYISALYSHRVNNVMGIGAQNVFFEEQGAFTGEIGPAMFKDLGVTHIIVGHSERRAGIGGDMETDAIVARKAQAVLESGMHPIMCIGEKDRDINGLYLDILKNQIKNSLSGINKKFANQIIIAYEPLWAVGAKEAMDISTINEMAIFIKKVISDIYGHEIAISMKVLYGGAVNFRNAGDIILKGGVDGLLVGRESVNAPGFVELLKVVDPI